MQVVRKGMIRMFATSIKNQRIIIVKVKLAIAVADIAKFSTAIALIFVDLDIVDICSPVKHFKESGQKGHQILKKS